MAMSEPLQTPLNDNIQMPVHEYRKRLYKVNRLSRFAFEFY